MAEFFVGLTRDLLDAAGAPAFGREALHVLDGDATVKWEFFPEPTREITPAHLARYDALYINAPLVTRASFAEGAGRTRVIARHGVGYDSVDVGACSDNGVLLTIQPDGVRRPVAVAALTFVMALSQKLFTKDRLTRGGRWAEKNDHMGMGLIGRTLGVVGAGSIGREILRLARPFGLNLLAADPYADAATVAADGGRLVDLATLLRESDFVVVICLLTPQTHHLIGAAQLALMKPGAFLINVARGPIVDEAALIAALREKRIAGAGLDVFEQEPVDPANPLLAMDNVIVTPHALCWTDECFRGIAESGFASIIAAAHGRRPRNVVNPKALAHPRVAGWLMQKD
ncbi:MAG TPA: NAD(P)-dependent oxidoreductase [Acetobacteraceae bacterium]|nr:NAD(P)-dependent oxidoreductase [Acetobacteraceae bacterium]